MRSVRQHTAIVLVGVTLASLLASCGESKVAQCNKLVDQVNKLEPLGKQFEQEATTLEKSFNKAKSLKEVTATAGQAATTIDKFATNVDANLKELKVIELEDEKLKGFQGSYVKVVEDLNQGIRDMGQALGTMSTLTEKPEDLKKLTKISSEIEVSTKKLDTAEKESSKVISELNSYCSGK